ncbi:MAG TPA: hypothetical protein VFT98_22420 [Myxococcota bacterium]|nr:hypothetical protein [Myxococcota bacterium]
MTVSERDREQFRRIGAAKAESHREALAAHLALTLEERLARSWDLYRRFRDPNSPAREDDPTPLYDRARALGLYRS